MNISTDTNAAIYIPKFDVSDSPSPNQITFVEFFINAQECFTAISKMSQKEKEEKRKNFKALKTNIKTALNCTPKNADEPFLETIKKLEQLSINIKIAKNKLDGAHETNSFLFMMTMNKTHFKPVVPNGLIISPEQMESSILKVNPDDLLASFMNINKLQKPELKLRGLIQLMGLIEDKIEKLEEAKTKPLTKTQESELEKQIEQETIKLAKVEEFGKDCVSFNDLVQSIPELKDKEISNLVDIDGKKHALHLLMPSIALGKQNLSMNQKVGYLVSLLVMLVEDRLKKNPTRTISSYMCAWAKSEEVFERYPHYKKNSASNQKVVTTILKILDNLKATEKNRKIVCEYLLNVFDPNAAIRLEAAKKLPLVKACSESAKIKNCLVKFGYSSKPVDEILFQTNSKSKAPKITSESFLEKVKTGDYKSEIEFVAKILKHYEVIIYSQFKPTTSLDNFEDLCKQIEEVNLKVCSYFLSALNSCKNEKEQINVYKAVLDLCVALARLGEFTFSSSLKQLILERNKAIYSKAWNSVANTKEFSFLDQLFNSNGHFKNLNKFIDEKLKKVACLPQYGKIQKNIIYMNDVFKNLTSELKDQLESILNEKIDLFYSLLGKKYVEKDPSLMAKAFKTITTSSDVNETAEDAKQAAENKEQEEKTALFQIGKVHLLDDYEILLDILSKFNSDQYDAYRDLCDTIKSIVEQQQIILDYTSQLLVDKWTLDILHKGELWQSLQEQTDLISIIQDQKIDKDL